MKSEKVGFVGERKTGLKKYVLLKNVTFSRLLLFSFSLFRKVLPLKQKSGCRKWNSRKYIEKTLKKQRKDTEVTMLVTYIEIFYQRIPD